MNERLQYLKSITFDWAGTVIDFGSCAPAAVFQRVFASRGIAISVEQARGPMGMSKREHIAAVAGLPEVQKAWRNKFGTDFGDHDLESLYQEFLPLQKQILKEYSELIPGAGEAVQQCRELGLKIGSCTGYTRDLMQVVSEEARQQGYVPDCVICAEDTPRGRPAPYLVFEAAKRMDVYPMWTMVVVDDTPVGIESGRNAGCWTIGVTRTGNCVGRTEEELNRLSASEIQELCNGAARRLREAGAHYVVESVAEIPRLLWEIDRLGASGKLPMEGC